MYLYSITLIDCPPQIRNKLNDWYNYAVYQLNPIVQILYVVLVFCLFVFYYAYGIDQFFPHRVVSRNYCYFGYVLLYICLYVFYLTCTVSPGIINKKNLTELKKKYSITTILMTNPNNECQTCKIPMYISICNIYSLDYLEVSIA